MCRNRAFRALKFFNCSFTFSCVAPISERTILKKLYPVSSLLITLKSRYILSPTTNSNSCRFGFKWRLKITKSVYDPARNGPLIHTKCPDAIERPIAYRTACSFILWENRFLKKVFVHQWDSLVRPPKLNSYRMDALENSRLNLSSAQTVRPVSYL